ncbi:YbaB/EbfC family nucleoid-associated protein [Micromonospora costi]|uniref:YbaB/EbfC family DNA-binding protein n=1 Tax=Micromonospora costi TaxID=1530042 RepID=A0A3A9ZPK0_9ACTN|nr:YbaB/EbfC family DNA-binding protein [Micromonospora costi]RKN50103.1 YbaB/EbfC family DNA-binding protein [Micromonospora costi]
MWADEAALDAAARRLGEWEKGITDRAARAKTLSSQVQALSGTARSADHLVEVTVDSSGALVALRLDERTRQQPAARTAAQILATTKAAQADLLRQVTAVATGTLGDDDPTAQAVVDSYRRRLDADTDAPDDHR